jgi:hypothetical protein
MYGLKPVPFKRVSSANDNLYAGDKSPAYPTRHRGLMPLLGPWRGRRLGDYNSWMRSMQRLALGVYS